MIVDFTVNVTIRYVYETGFCFLKVPFDRTILVRSRYDKTVVRPFLKEAADLYNINAHTKFGEDPLTLSSGK